MAKKKRKEEARKDDPFGLAKPTPDIDELKKTNASASENAGQPADISESTLHHHSTLKEAEARYKQMGWRGIDEPDEEVEPDFSIKKEPIPQDELDMTPMVDVTFLLLIFFMVTASFTMQQSVQQPPATSQDAALETTEDDTEDNFITVIIDQTNTYYVTSKDVEEEEAPSEREMRSLVKNAKEVSNATKMVIRAHVDSMHRKLITAWDAGTAAGIEEFEVKTTTEDF